MSTSTFGSRLRTLREGMSLTLQEASALVGIHYSTLSLIERDKRKPSVTVLNCLADVYCVSRDYLIDGRQSDGSE